MARLVLVAKHANVWLHQLSQRHGRAIERLDQIPDEALAELADWGFSGLWLVGLWRRSPASRRIKRLLGRPHAEASAYAVYSYEVGERFGGESALQNLKRRAAKVGLRLAVDMVPNHTGLDAPWLATHPDRYLSLPGNPLINYAFTGPNLSEDPHMELYLEDHYTDQSDAAVVFKHVLTETGEERFIYHGNDGVGVPWNDTAQLDFLNPETRRAVIDQIVDVAKRFPIVRFDAAMTLVNQHIQRLWHPKRGQHGYIFTRQNHRLTDAEFARRMPREFWEEAVERLRQEAPDTLLLAEAFWLLEANFVQQLGLHRAYNSSFMHNLRAEENAAFRHSLKQALAFDPRLLAHYVNYMSTPDEPSAAEQFGRGDKFFGVATLLATLPGLPMFGHGHVEGYAENYAMDLAEPFRDEQPDPDLVARHRQLIAPLLRRRELFSGVEHFRLYDVETSRGRVLEDVIAFSDRLGDQRALVLFNNSPNPQRGRISQSVPFVTKPTGKAQQESLLQSLDLELGSWLATSTDNYQLPVTIPLDVSLKPYEAQVYIKFELA